MSSETLNVVYSGEGLFPSDLAYLRTDTPLHIETIPALGTLTPPQSFADKLKHCDLLIFKVNGAFEFIRYMQTFGHVPSMQAILHSPTTKKVLWSVDTHVMHGLESHLSHLEYFDKIYSAHSEFMLDFDEKKSSWLPCCYRLSSMEDLIRFNQRTYTPERDLLFYYNPTPTGDRNELALRAKAICDKMGLLSLFGHVGTWNVFPQFIKTSRLNLNLSMCGELNYRFFELQAFNAIQICDHVSEQGKVAVEWSNVHCIERDLSNLEAVLTQTISHAEAVESQNHILRFHMLIHRIALIIQEAFGVGLRIDNESLIASQRQD